MPDDLADLDEEVVAMLRGEKPLPHQPKLHMNTQIFVSTAPIKSTKLCEVCSWGENAEGRYHAGETIWMCKECCKAMVPAAKPRPYLLPVLASIGGITSLFCCTAPFVTALWVAITLGVGGLCLAIWGVRAIWNNDQTEWTDGTCNF